MTDPPEILVQLPSGAGLMLIGVDNAIVTSNKILENKSVGVVVL